jgi:hypothetical protein
MTSGGRELGLSARAGLRFNVSAGRIRLSVLHGRRRGLRRSPGGAGRSRGEPLLLLGTRRGRAACVRESVGIGRQRRRARRRHLNLGLNRGRAGRSLCTLVDPPTLSGPILVEPLARPHARGQHDGGAAYPLQASS